MKIYQNLSWKFLKFTFGNFAKHYFNIKCINQDFEPEPPYLLLANHNYFIDAFFISMYLKNPVHFLASDEIMNFFQEILGKLVGLVYIQKGITDTSAVKELLKHLNNKESIAVFPEGDGTWDGETDEISNSVIKFVRLNKIPILTVKIKGGYLTRPR